MVLLSRRLGKMASKRQVDYATTRLMARLLMGCELDDLILRLPKRKHMNPWDNVHIPKAKRKGKTYEELRSMRKTIWEEEQPEPEVKK